MYTLTSLAVYCVALALLFLLKRVFGLFVSVTLFFITTYV